MITKENKEKIVAAMGAARNNFAGSDAKFAETLGISGAQYSRVMKGELERVLSDSKWMVIASQLEVNLGGATEWKTANTPVFEFIISQLGVCQEELLSGLLCDLSDIGKTWAAKFYSRNHKNVAYIDCSVNKSKSQMIRAIAKSYGLDSKERLMDVEAALVYYLKTLEKPLIILDEAGDLYYEAFLEIKALWNATEGSCGWYMMGADGLKAKIERSINCAKVGYAEIFSRFGKRYGHVPGLSGDAGKEMMIRAARMIAKVNGGEDVVGIVNRTMGDDGMPSLRRVYKEIRKMG